MLTTDDHRERVAAKLTDARATAAGVGAEGWCPDCADLAGMTPDALRSAWQAGRRPDIVRRSDEPCALCGDTTTGERRPWHVADTNDEPSHADGVACSRCRDLISSGDGEEE